MYNYHELILKDYNSHLSLSSLCYSCNCIVAFVFVHRTQITDACLVSTTVDLDQFVVLRADLLL